jgi:hypothetical protein
MVNPKGKRMQRVKQGKKLYTTEKSRMATLRRMWLKHDRAARGRLCEHEDNMLRLKMKREAKRDSGVAYRMAVEAEATILEESAQQYHPRKGAWQHAAPATQGFDEDKLAAAVRFAEINEIDWSTDLHEQLTKSNAFEGPPQNKVLGPLLPRGPSTGVVVKGGKIVAQWGDPERVDVTFSCSKSYIATCYGLAYDEGLIRDMDEPVSVSLPEVVEFNNSPRHKTITWRNLLELTSEWEGELWGKTEVIDRNRVVGIETRANQHLPQQPAREKGEHRSLRAPGTWYEYNDVRVNLAAYALLELTRNTLPSMLAEDVMNPIGASDTWRWHGYHSSWCEIDGEKVQSVSGGAHWGGGMHISSLDHARFGLLMARGGVWEGQRLLSDEWVEMAASSSKCNPDYGGCSRSAAAVCMALFDSVC